MAYLKEKWRLFPMAVIKCIIFGSISKEKGYSRAIEVIKKNKNIHLTIVGPLWNPIEKPTSDSLKKLSKLNKNLSFEERKLSEEEFKEYAKNSDILLFPYLTTSQSGMFHRVIGYNKPIIAWKLPFFQEMEKKYNACLTVNSIEDLEKAIISISKNKKLKQKLITGLKKLRKETSWEKVAEMHIELYKNLF